MTSAPAKRTCRHCPAVIADVPTAAMTGLCRSCQQRSEDIRAALAPDIAVFQQQHAPAPVLGTEHEHHACEHYQPLVTTLATWIADCGWCAVCSAELPDNGSSTAALVHKAGCALAAILEGDR